MGNPDPWSQAAIQQNERWLKAYVLSAVGSITETEDIIQEVFRIAWEKREDFAEGTNFGGWLREITKRIISRHFEGAKRKRCLIDNEEVIRHLDAAAAKHEERMIDADDRERKVAILRKCIKALAGRLKDIIRMKYLNGFRSARIAETLGITVNSVNVASLKGRRLLMDCMEKGQ